MSPWRSSGAPMDDVLNGLALLLVGHDAVILFAVQVSLVRLGERGLGENHLAVPGYLQPVGPAELGRVRRVLQGQELSQPVQGEAAIAAAVAVAVYQQQVATTPDQVAVKSAALEEAQPASQSQDADGIPLQEGVVDGQSQSDGGGAPEGLGKLQDLLRCTRPTWGGKTSWFELSFPVTNLYK